MSSSTDNTKTRTCAVDKEGDDSIKDIAATKQLTLQIQDLSIENEESDTPTLSTNNADNTNNNNITCAACGKEGEEDSMNICNKCKMVHYCNAVCKKKNKSKHKKKCDRRVAELYDEALFNEPPPREDCPICFLPLPLGAGQTRFKSCCGKYICQGCAFAIVDEDMKKKKEDRLCPYCRMPRPSSNEEILNLLTNLIEKGNAMAYYQFGGDYAEGTTGMPQDWAKANDLWLKAGELGYAEAYSALGLSYYHGQGVDMDEEKAKYFYELAAMKGDVHARHNFGCMEAEASNHQRAYKHMIIAARAGFTPSLDQVKIGFMDGDVAKDEYAGTLRAFHERQSEMKSEARDQAADLEAQRASERS